MKVILVMWDSCGHRGPESRTTGWGGSQPGDISSANCEQMLRVLHFPYYCRILYIYRPYQIPLASRFPSNLNQG